jgi:rhodanese-related sulfurtransferase
MLARRLRCARSPTPASHGNFFPRMGPQRLTIHDLLKEARAGLVRLTPEAAWRASRDGAILVDTRSDEQRREQGVIPGARIVPLSVLEWRVDPASDCADDVFALDARIVLICSEGYSSSLAAARLQALGFAHATDVVDGVQGWRDAGLPLIPV